jgi:hypothetical protein
MVADDQGRQRQGGLSATRGCGKIARRANFRLTRRANQSYGFARLTRQEGRIMIVTKRGMGCGGRGSVRRETGIAGRIELRERSNGVLTTMLFAYGEVVWS